ncbi:L-ribulokinase, partial [mine drainage metagenome]
IVESLRDNGVAVNGFIASGGLPVKSPLMMQIYSDVLKARITLPESAQSVAMGAAILGCIAADAKLTGYQSITDTIRAMARQRTDLAYEPDVANARQYDNLYTFYRKMTDANGVIAGVMHGLRSFA